MMDRLRSFARGVFAWLQSVWAWIMGPVRYADAEASAAQRDEVRRRERVRTRELGIGTPEPPVYRLNKSLFSDHELVLLRALDEAIENQYRLFGKVRMGDFVWLRNEPTNRKYHNNQVLCKHVDFLVCDITTQAPLLVIELDDSTHQRYDRKESDDFKNRTFHALGLPIRRMPVQSTYPIPELRELITTALASRRRHGQ